MIRAPFRRFGKWAFAVWLVWSAVQFVILWPAFKAVFAVYAALWK